jgi:hypothetical protein
VEVPRKKELFQLLQWVSLHQERPRALLHCGLESQARRRSLSDPQKADRVVQSRQGRRDPERPEGLVEMQFGEPLL